MPGRGVKPQVDVDVPAFLGVGVSDARRIRWRGLGHRAPRDERERLDTGRLAQTGCGWWWIGQPQLSPGLAELVRDRIGVLTELQREVVDVLAFGELTDPLAIEQIETRGLIDTMHEGPHLRARLAHPPASDRLGAADLALRTNRGD